MDSARSWFQKFQPRERLRSSSKKKEPSDSGEGSKLPTAEEAPSNATKQKVAAAKQYIEKHYKEQMKSLQERRERYLSPYRFTQNFTRHNSIYDYKEFYFSISLLKTVFDPPKNLRQ